MDSYLIPILLGGAFTLGICLLLFLQWYDVFFMKSKTLAQIDRFSGFTFEKYLAVLFREQGYQVTVTPDRADFGADLLIKKEGINTAVQAKRFNSTVGISAVQEVVAAKSHYHCHRAMVVTNSTFTKAAWKLAHSNQVWLVDRKRLTDMIRQVDAKRKKK